MLAAPAATLASLLLVCSAPSPVPALLTGETGAAGWWAVPGTADGAGKLALAASCSGASRGLAACGGQWDTSTFVKQMHMLLM